MATMIKVDNTAAKIIVNMQHNIEGAKNIIGKINEIDELLKPLGMKITVRKATNDKSETSE